MRLKDRICIPILLIVFALCIIRIGFYATTLYQYQMDMDEAIHAIHGLDMAVAMQQGSIPQLVAQFLKPHWYPPAHGFMLGVWDLLVGPGTGSARLYSTVWLVISVVLIWLTTRTLYPQAERCVLLLPALFLMADQLHSIYGAMSMLETTVLALTLAALWLFIRAEDQLSGWLYLAAGGLALLCFLVKYSSGILLLATLFFSAFLSIGRRWWAQRERSLFLHARPLLPMALLIGVVLFGWLIGLEQLQWLLVYSGAQPERYALWATDNLLYYPLQLVSDPNNLLALSLTLLALPTLLSNRDSRRSVLPYLIYFGLALVMLTATLQNNLRFGMILFPVIWLLAPGSLVTGVGMGWRGGATASQKNEKIEASPQKAINGFPIRDTVILGIFLLALFGLVRTQMQLRPLLIEEYENINTGVDAAYAFIAETFQLPFQQAPADQVSASPPQITLIGRQDQWNGRALRFYLESRCMADGAHCPLDLIDDKDIKEDWPRREYSDEEQQARFNARLESSDYLILIDKALDNPEPWQMLATESFTFARVGKSDAVVDVTILKRK